MSKDLDNKIYTIKEVSKILKIHSETVKKLVKRDENSIPSFKVGGEIRVRRSTLSEWMKIQERRNSKSAFEDMEELKIPVYSRRIPKGGTVMKVKNVGKNRWKVDFGGFYKKQNPSGFMSWYIWYYDENRVRKCKVVHLAANKEDAHIELIYALNEERDKAFCRKHYPEKARELGYFEDEENNKNIVNLSDLMDEWHENYGKIELADKGRGALAVVRYWKNTKFAKKKAGDVTKGDIKSHFAEELKTVLRENNALEKAELNEVKRKAKQTQRQRGAVLKSIYNWAEDMGQYGIKENPVNGNLPKKQDKESEPFTSDEIELLFKKAEALYPHMVSVMKCASVTGARIGELQNLKLENVNLEKGFIEIVNPKEKKNKKIDIDEHCVLYQTMKKIKEERQKMDERDFRNSDYEYAFVYWNRRFKKWSRVPIADHFLELRRETGIENKSFHTFRHTASSIASSNGVNTKAYQAIYGHSTSKMTDHYTHASREDKLNALKTVEKQLLIGNSAKGEKSEMASSPQGY